jgi:hypothetical protein
MHRTRVWPADRSQRMAAYLAPTLRFVGNLPEQARIGVVDHVPARANRGRGMKRGAWSRADRDEIAVDAPSEKLAGGGKRRGWPPPPPAQPWASTVQRATDAAGSWTGPLQ